MNTATLAYGSHTWIACTSSTMFLFLNSKQTDKYNFKESFIFLKICNCKWEPLKAHIHEFYSIPAAQVLSRLCCWSKDSVWASWQTATLQTRVQPTPSPGVRKSMRRRTGRFRWKRKRRRIRRRMAKSQKRTRRTKQKKNPRITSANVAVMGMEADLHPQSWKKPSELFSPRILFDSHVGGIACQTEAIHISQSGYCWNANTFEQTCREPGIQMVDPG